MSSRVRDLFQSSDDDVPGLAADILSTPDGLSDITAEEWLEILRRDDKPVALAAACSIASAHLPPSRLSLERCIELACRDVQPVAELGLQLSKMKPLQGPAAVSLVMTIGRAKFPKVRQDGVQWAIQVIERSPHSRVEHLIELMGAPYEDARRQAAGVMTRSLRFKDALELWAALARSPHADARNFLLLHLSRRKAGLPSGSLRHLWATSLLTLSRVQGEVKRAVVERINQRIEANPEEADALLPLLEIAGAKSGSSGGEGE